MALTSTQIEKRNEFSWDADNVSRLNIMPKVMTVGIAMQNVSPQLPGGLSPAAELAGQTVNSVADVVSNAIDSVFGGGPTEINPTPQLTPAPAPAPQPGGLFT